MSARISSIEQVPIGGFTPGKKVTVLFHTETTLPGPNGDTKFIAGQYPAIMATEGEIKLEGTLPIHLETFFQQIPGVVILTGNNGVNPAKSLKRNGQPEVATKIATPFWQM